MKIQITMRTQIENARNNYASRYVIYREQFYKFAHFNVVSNCAQFKITNGL